MMRLKPLDNTELTAYVVELLNRQEIYTLNDLLQTELTKLEKITNLSKNVIIDLHRKLQNYFLSTPQRLSSRLNKIYYGFNIRGLDSILGDETLFAGSVFEVTGIAGGIGKTQFCHTIIVDLLQRHRALEALYIDTKKDFSATRCFQMLLARNVDKGESGRILQRILVEDCFSSHSVINVLENIRKELETAKAGHSNKLRLIVIDSLTIWFLHTFSDDEDRIQGKYLLSKLANCIYKIANIYGIAFLLVNLQITTYNNKDIPDYTRRHDDCTNMENIISNQYDASCSSTLASNDSTAAGVQRVPALGLYWRRIPRVRLLLKTRKDDDEHPFRRCIEVVKSSYSLTGSHCFVKITDAGIVDDDDDNDSSFSAN